jgi:DNA-binding CsgD family transcriptional regulator
MAPGAGTLLIDLAARAHDVDAIMAAVSRTLRTAMGAGPVFLAPADPLTGAFSGAFLFDIPTQAAGAFADIERRNSDIATFAKIATHPGPPIASLYAEADGQPRNSERWREIIEPLHWGDEIRAVVRSHGYTWGYLCLHRQANERPFRHGDLQRLTALLPAVAFAMRNAASLADRHSITGTGVVLADPLGHVTASTEGGAAWLAELAPPTRDTLPVPVARLVHVASTSGSMVSATIITRSGRAAYVQAAPLEGPGQPAIAVTLSTAPLDVAIARFAAQTQLTARESQILSEILAGEPTGSIAHDLSISPRTVQAHLTSIFEKTGARSRGELVRRIRN